MGYKLRSRVGIPSEGHLTSPLPRSSLPTIESDLHPPGRTRTALEFVVCMAPFIFIAWVVWRYVPVVPFGDSWEMVPVLQAVEQTGISAQELWKQHNEHRLVFPKLLMLGLAGLTQWDTRWEVAVSLGCALASFVVIFFLLRRTLRPALRSWVLVTLLVAAVFMFSPVRSHDWIWGWQVQWFMSVLGLLLTVGILEFWPERRDARLGLALAVAAALFGQYSLSNGALIWGSGLVVILLRSRYRRLAPAWILAALASTGAYLYNLETPAGLPPRSHFVEFPGESVRYVALYLGRPFSEVPQTAIAAGLVLTGVFVVAGSYLILSKRGDQAGVPAWIGIGCFAVGSAVVTAVGRVGFGARQAGETRYTTISVLFAISTLALLTVAFMGRSPKGGGRAAGVLAIWMLAGGVLLWHYPDQVQEIADLSAQRIKDKECLERVTSADDPCLLILYPKGEIIFERTQVLKEKQWGPFSPP